MRIPPSTATLFGAIPLSVLLAGCFCFLPPGEPPEGAITCNHLNEAGTEIEAENRLTTLLTAFMLTHPEYSRFRLECAPPHQSRLRRIFLDAAATGGAVVAEDAPTTLSADFAAELWIFEIVDDNKVVWRESAAVIPAAAAEVP